MGEWGREYMEAWCGVGYWRHLRWAPRGNSGRWCRMLICVISPTDAGGFILAWKTPWTGEPGGGGVQSMGSQKRWLWLNYWAHTHTYTHMCYGLPQLLAMWGWKDSFRKELRVLFHPVGCSRLGQEWGELRHCGQVCDTIYYSGIQTKIKAEWYVCIGIRIRAMEKCKAWHSNGRCMYGEGWICKRAAKGILVWRWYLVIPHGGKGAGHGGKTSSYVTLMGKGYNVKALRLILDTVCWINIHVLYVHAVLMTLLYIQFGNQLPS